MPKKITKQDFINKANIKHKFRYNYDNIHYINMVTKVSIECNIHGTFLQAPDTHLRCNGCPKCAYEYDRYKNTRHSTVQFIKKANDRHNFRYNYDQCVYVGDNHQVLIGCKIHGNFLTTAGSHLQGTGCQKCSKKYKRSTEEFIAEANIVHNNKYNYSTTVFYNTKTNVDIVCRDHGMFKQNPNVHLNGGMCPRCRSVSFSKVANEWLEYLMKTQNINIQYANNGGEFTIPSTNIKVDGFCKDKNTIYEFYGDFFHGNPMVYSSTFLNKLLNKTAEELYNRTINKEKIIKQYGYNLITIWEFDWIKLREKVCN